MSIVNIALNIATIATGLFTGLLLTMLWIFEPLLDSLSAAEYAELMQRFLQVARRSPLNIALMLISLIAPIPALVKLVQTPNSLVFLLTLAGAIAFFVGMFLVSRFLNEPLYDEIMSWQPQTPPDDWQQARRRWHGLNLVRVWGCGIAFLVFLTALNLMPC